MNKTNLDLETSPLLVHLQHPDSEVILDITKINFIHKTGNIFYVVFAGAATPLTLPNEMGRGLWELMRSSSITIHPKKAVADNKIAEPLASEGFSELPNDDHNAH